VNRAGYCKPHVNGAGTSPWLCPCRAVHRAAMRRGWKQQVLLGGARGNPGSPPKAREHPRPGKGQLSPGAGAACKRNLGFAGAPGPAQPHGTGMRGGPALLSRALMHHRPLQPGRTWGSSRAVLGTRHSQMCPAAAQLCVSVSFSAASARLAGPLDGLSGGICKSDKTQT